MTESSPSPRPDLAEITRWASLLRAPMSAGAVVELRAPRTPKGVQSGYFDDPEPLARAAAALSGRAEAVYTTLCPCLRDLLARACNRVEPYAKHTTADRDILRRHWFLIDFDPVRPAGISATEEEHQAALQRAGDCRDWLTGQGWPPPIYADSGNGAHLLYPTDLPNTPESTTLLERCLQALAARFNDLVVSVDPTTFNASRISKVYGTAACKGDSLPDLGRVHRIARILAAPARLEVVDFLGGSP